MSKIVEFLSQNPYLMVLSLILTPIAFVMGIYQARRKQIGYLLKTNLLVDDSVSKVEGLDILFQGKNIDTLSVSHFKLFNSGNTIIEKGDIYKGHELKIEFEDSEVKILSTKMVYQSSDTINATTFLSDNAALVSFDALEKMDSLIISIYHTHKNPNPELSGKIKEGKIIDYSKAVVITEFLLRDRLLPYLILSSIIIPLCSIVSYFTHTEDSFPIPFVVTVIIAIMTLTSVWYVNKMKNYNDWKGI